MTSTTIIIPGSPATGSFKFTKAGHKYTPSNVAEWRAYVRLMVMQAMKECIPERHPVEVTIIIRKPRVKSLPKNANAKWPCPWAWVTKPDVDNCTKGLFDAAKTVAFHDDAQVTDLIVRKRWGEREEVEIRIRELSEEDAKE